MKEDSIFLTDTRDHIDKLLNLVTNKNKKQALDMNKQFFEKYGQKFTFQVQKKVSNTQNTKKIEKLYQELRNSVYCEALIPENENLDISTIENCIEKIKKLNCLEKQCKSLIGLVCLKRERLCIRLRNLVKKESKLRRIFNY